MMCNKIIYSQITKWPTTIIIIIIIIISITANTTVF